MSTALYRRYRPDTFSDVIGQEHVTAPLITALGKDAVSHAYLFSGPRGCGKTTSARILARCLNCEQGPTGHPCGECESCLDLATGGSGSLDVIEIDAASHGGVDDARDLRERATFAPVRDRYKIFIIDEAHMVTAAGFNALLKIVEEPPAHIKFIFATTEPDKVIGTIRSRTHHYPFRLVPPEPLLHYLKRLCEQENVPVAPGVLSLVIRAGGGSVRDTLSVLDQLIAGSSETGIDYDRATALLGFTHATLLDDVVDSVAALDGATAFGVVDRVVQSGQDPRRFVEDLLERLRDLIIVKSVPDSPGAILRGVPEDQIHRMQDQAAKVGAAELSRAADITAQALTDMVGATSPRLHLELLMARLLLPHAEQGHSSLAARLERLERRLDFVSGAGVTPAGEHPTPSAEPADREQSPAPATAATEESAPETAESAQTAERAAPAPAQDAADEWATPGVPREAEGRPEPESADDWAAPGVEREKTREPAPEPASAPQEDPEHPARQTSPRPEPAPQQPAPAQSAPQSSAPQDSAQEAAQPGGSTVEMMRRAWPDIVETLKSQSRMLWMLVKGNVTVSSFDGQTLTLAFSNDGARNTFSNRRGDQALNAAIQQVLGMQVSFDLITGGAPPADGGGAPKAEAGSARTPEPVTSPASPEPQPGPDAPPAWVVEEEAPEPVEPEPEAPQQPPSPHPAWDGEPSRDPAGVTDSDDAPEEKDPFYESSPAEPSASTADETYKPFDEKPPVPVFARKSSEAPSSASPSAAGRGSTPGAGKKAAGGNNPGSSTGTGASNGRLAEIKQRMAQRRAEASIAYDAPPPDPTYDEGPPQDHAQAAPSRSGPEAEDVPSDDDIAVEESTVFGRKALERLLGATLIEERRLGDDL